MESGEFAFTHREGKDIGGFVATKVLPIQFLNLGIIDQ